MGNNKVIVVRKITKKMVALMARKQREPFDFGLTTSGINCPTLSLNTAHACTCMYSSK